MIYEEGAVVEDVRNLVSVVQLDDVITHTNADSLELAIVGGWQCCVRKGEFKKGDKVLYCEIDSLLPISNPNFAFLEERKEGLKLIDEKVYARIKTIRLRKELSQGLVIPLPKEFEIFPVGTNVTLLMDVLKYEPVAQKPEGYVARKTWLDKLCRLIRGSDEATLLSPWPSFLNKSDQDRVQNKSNAYRKAVESGEEFEVTYKLDGASMTAFSRVLADNSLKVGVCSRNNEILIEGVEWSFVEQCRNWLASFILANRRILKVKRLITPRWKTGINADDNEFVKALRKYELEERLKEFWEVFGIRMAVQGELVGPGIQHNFERLKEQDFFVYDIWVIQDNSGLFAPGTKMLPDDARDFAGRLGLRYVPVLRERMKLLETVALCLYLAEGPSAFHSEGYREGLVFKSVSRPFSFKAISNTYLLKNDG